MLANVATAITPTCVSGTMPVGTGGTIVDGTYVLTSQTYYQDSSCPSLQLSETIAIAGDCVQVVFGGIFSGTLAGRMVTQGNGFTSTPICQQFNVDGAVTFNPQTKTYTASGTTFTLFSASTAMGSSDVAVFTRL